jgi:hypothetical protein
MLEDRGKKGCLGPNLKFYATFRNTVAEELAKLPYIRTLNDLEIREYQFKLATLDLVALYTDRAETYGEKEGIKVDADPELARNVLKALNWEGWPVRMRTIEGGTVAKPVAVRQYERIKKKKWILKGDEEVQ